MYKIGQAIYVSGKDNKGVVGIYDSLMVSKSGNWKIFFHYQKDDGELGMGCVDINDKEYRVTPMMYQGRIYKGPICSNTISGELTSDSEDTPEEAIIYEKINNAINKVKKRINEGKVERHQDFSTLS